MVREIKNFLHGYEARAAGIIYGMPTRRIKTIAVTGTDGKTTTSSLIHHILTTAGFSTAVITTVGAYIGGTTYDTGLHTTTPSSFFLQKYIKKAVDEGCEYLVLEVTSHALDQNRVLGIDIHIAALTNITHEHLDYHGSYDNYLLTKSKLFRKAAISIINKDDISYARLKDILKDKNVLTYSMNGSSDFNLKNIKLKLRTDFDFNKQNFLAGIAVARTLGIDNDTISRALATFRFPEGRQEIVYDKDFKIVLDFAHTPNSFKSILPALKSTTKGRLIHVFGAAGQRDKSKRPLMGEISSNYSNIIVLTAEDPRNEAIDDINKEIELGIKGFAKGDPNQNPSDMNFYEIDDRSKAIGFAVSIAAPGDTVVITGKGHEKSLNLGHGEIPWSDKEAIANSIKKNQITA